MSKFTIFFLGLFCCEVGLSLSANHSELPLYKGLPWIKSEKLLVKLKEERTSLVSVQSKGKNGVNHLEITGGIVMKINNSEAFLQSQKFTFLPKISGFIKSVNVRTKNEELEVLLEAFGYYLPLIFKYQFRSTEEVDEIQLRVKSGPLKDLIVSLTYADYRRIYTLLSIRSLFKAKEYPFPKIFLTFGIEVVLKNIATQLRSYLENPKSNDNS